MSPLPKRYAYRKRRSIAKKKLQLIQTTSVQPAPKNVSPESNPPTTTTTTTKPKKSTTLKREIKGLFDTQQPERRSPKVEEDLGNRLIHWTSLQNLVHENCKCKKCNGPVRMLERTVGISTEVTLTCNDCNVKENSFVRRTKYDRLSFHKSSSESHAINCQFILALMQIGGGHSESEILLNFLDLPNASTFKKKTFSRVQTAIRTVIETISNDSMIQSRNEEIKATIGETLFAKFLKKKLHPKDVQLTVSYDMGWNKRSSGHKYDSISGHGFVLGGIKKKILNHRCLSKCCRICDRDTENQKTPHECPKNHNGSSKSMETEAIFQMVKEGFYQHGYSISTIISDDDSTMKANLKHSLKEKVEEGLMREEDWPRTKNNVKKKDNGRLPLDIEEPKFLADFNHCVKTVGKRFYELTSAPQRTSQVDSSLARRMKLNSGTMMKQVRHMDWEKNEKQIKQKIMAPVEHLFVNHEYCGKWCYVLKARNVIIYHIYVEKYGTSI